MFLLQLNSFDVTHLLHIRLVCYCQTFMVQNAHQSYRGWFYVGAEGTCPQIYFCPQIPDSKASWKNFQATDFKCRPICSLYVFGFGEWVKWTQQWRGWFGKAPSQNFWARTAPAIMCHEETTQSLTPDAWCRSSEGHRCNKHSDKNKKKH